MNKTIDHTHTNGVPFSRGLRNDILTRMEARYNLPKNESYLYYDMNKDISFVHKPGGLRIVCTLNKGTTIDSFHNSHAINRA
jgi:hypothetical protein